MGAAVASIGSSLIGGVLGGKGADKAARQQAAGYGQAAGGMSRAVDYFKELQQPYQQMGQEAINPLMDTINGQYRDPLLDQIQNQASQQVMQNASLEGRYGAGDMPGLMATAMINPAMQLRQQRIGNLSNIVGMGQNSASNMGQAGMSGAGQVGQMQMGAADARASGTLAKYGAYQNALSGAMSSAGGMFGGAPQAPSTPFQFTNPLSTALPMGSATGYGGMPNYLLPRG